MSTESRFIINNFTNVDTFHHWAPLYLPQPAFSYAKLSSYLLNINLRLFTIYLINIPFSAKEEYVDITVGVIEINKSIDTYSK